jgi:hypothetical protein
MLPLGGAARGAEGVPMTDDRNTPPRRVPILTEVVLFSEPEPIDIPIEEPAPLAAPAAAPASASASAPATAIASAPAADAALPVNVEEQLIERVLADLQRQVDLMLEYRLREILAPILSRATEALIRDSRQQLASTLRDVVARAVAQELSRHRGR